MSTFTGTMFGAVQTNYYDQMGTALAGDLFSPADKNLTDSCTISTVGGIKCGLFVKSKVGTSSRSGIGNYGVESVGIGDESGDVYGVLVRSQATQTDADGHSYVDFGRMGVVLRKDRVGGRIWMECGSSFTEGSTAYVVVSNEVMGNKLEVGSLTSAPVSGNVQAKAASGTVTFSGNLQAGDTIVIGSVTLTAVADSPSSNQFAVGTNLVTTLANIASLTVADVGLGVTGDSLVVTAATAGAAGNSIALSTTASNGVASGSTLTGGADATTTDDTVSLPFVKFRSSGAAGELALVEFVME